MSRTMNRVVLSLLCFAAALACTSTAGAAHTLESVKKLPNGLSSKVAALLDASGHRVVGDKGPVCEIWLLKQIPIQADFKASLGVQYPLTPGQLVGALHVPAGSTFSDFRGQQLKAGVYTLRYAHQPQDGNHFGQILDYLLALPASADQDPKVIADYDEFVKTSAKSAGANHPAIFSLQAVEKPSNAAELSHDADHDYWILSTPAGAKKADQSTQLHIRLIVVGMTTE